MRAFRLLLLLPFFLAPCVQAETRVFVSLAGTLLEGEIVSVSGESVTLKRKSDSQTLVVNRKTLCKEDGEYISRWQEQREGKPAETGGKAPAPATTPTTAPAVAGTGTPAALTPAQKYRIDCQILPSKSNRGPATGDQRIVELTYNFNLSNQEVSRDLLNARGMVITLGKNAAETNGDLIVLQKEEFEVNIKAQTKTVYTSPPVLLTYSSDPDAAYGVKNYGYVLIIRDAAGAVLIAESSPITSAKYIKEILALPKAPCVVDRDFRHKTRSEVPIGYISF